MRILSVLWISVVVAAQPLFAGTLFSHDFDRAGVGSRDIEGGDFYGYELLDKGITEQHYVSRRHAAFAVVDFGQDQFGVVYVREADAPLDLSNAHLSAQVMASEDLTEHAGMVGFQLTDSDGTVARTRPEDLLSPGLEFKPVLQHATDITLVTERGDDGVLNLADITKYGLLVVDRDDIEKIVTIFFDDFAATRDE